MPPLDKRRQDENGRDVWPDKHTFCHAYKFNEDGLASRLQAAANEALWRQDEAHRRALNESGERVRKLYEQDAKLEAEVEALHTKLEEERARPRQDPEAIRKALCYDVLCDIVLREGTADEVLHAVWTLIKLNEKEMGGVPF